MAISLRAVNWDFFGQSDVFEWNLRRLEKPRPGEYAELFVGAKAANFWVFLCGFEENTVWVAIVMHLVPKENGKIEADAIEIIDPYETNRARRLGDIKDRLPRILAHGDIEVAEHGYQNLLRYIDIPRMYGKKPSGLVVFAIVCEVFRRLAVSKFLRKIDNNPDLQVIFGPFQMNSNFDAYRRPSNCPSTRAASPSSCRATTRTTP